MNLQEILYDAIKVGDKTEVETIIVDGGEMIDLSSDNYKAVTLAINANNKDVLEYILEQKTVKHSTDLDFSKLFRTALTSNNDFMIQMLLDMDHDGTLDLDITFSDVKVAVKNDNAKAMRRMATWTKIDTSQKNNILLHIAEFNNSTECEKELLEHDGVRFTKEKVLRKGVEEKAKKEPKLDESEKPVNSDSKITEDPDLLTR